jgi:hypothetical protein
VQCFHKAGVIPQDKCEIESKSDRYDKKLATLCQKLDAEAELDAFIHVDDDATVAADIRESGNDVAPENKKEDNDNETAITVM